MEALSEQVLQKLLFYLFFWLPSCIHNNVWLNRHLVIEQAKAIKPVWIQDPPNILLETEKDLKIIYLRKDLDHLYLGLKQGESGSSELVCRQLWARYKNRSKDLDPKVLRKLLCDIGQNSFEVKDIYFERRLDLFSSESASYEVRFLLLASKEKVFQMLDLVMGGES